MKFNIKFPYPIEVIPLRAPELIDETSSYYEYRINVPEVVLENKVLYENLASLILVAEVNCSATMYRECFESDRYEYIDLLIKKEDISNRFEVDCMILATKDIQFETHLLKRGMPFMHLGSHTFRLNSSRKGLITFIPSDNKDKLEFDFKDNVIKILLPKNEYDDLLKMKGAPMVKNLLLVYAQFALLEACNYLVEDSTKIHTQWYEELHRRWEEDNEEGTYPAPEEHYSFVENVMQNSNIELARSIINNEKQVNE